MKNRWFGGSLVASALLNLVLIGFLAGTLSGPPRWTRSSFDPTVGLGRLMRFLPEERREELRVDRDARREIRTSLRDMRRAQRAIHQALIAEPFDRDELTTTLDMFRDHFVASQSRSHAAFADIMAQLTPEERRRFVESMRRSKNGPAIGDSATRLRPLDGC